MQQRSPSPWAPDLPKAGRCGMASMQGQRRWMDECTHPPPPSAQACTCDRLAGGRDCHVRACVQVLARAQQELAHMQAEKAAGKGGTLAVLYMVMPV